MIEIPEDLSCQDQKLSSVVKEMGYCCGAFARALPEIKFTARKALSAYNFFFLNPNPLLLEDDLNLLFTSIKLLGNPATTLRKKEFISEYWDSLEQRLLAIGVSWQKQ
jgi:hypothetical protein